MKMTEGERFIAEYFKYSGIKYKREIKLENLKNDDKSYRMPDFFLPKYKTYVEFNGKWNTSDIEKERYREKKAVYNKNNISCVYIYPENLGIIDYIFTQRLIVELKRRSLKKELFKFQTKRFIDNRGSLFFWLFLSVFILFGDYTWSEDKPFLLMLFGVILFQLYRLIDGIFKFFIKNEIQF